MASFSFRSFDGCKRALDYTKKKSEALISHSFQSSNDFTQPDTLRQFSGLFLQIREKKRPKKNSSANTSATPALTAFHGFACGAS